MFKDNRRFLAFIIFSNFLINSGFQVWQTLFNNYAVEQVGVGPAGIGVIQAVREVPGLLGFALGFLAMYMSEVRIMSLSVLLLGAGVLLTGQAGNVAFLAAGTFIMSVGFHFFYPSSNAVILMSVDKKDTPRVLGQLGSLTAIASVVGTGAVYLLAARMGYRAMFFALGVIVIAGGLALLPFKNGKEGLPPNRKVVLRRKYWLYYTLSFLLGCRRHIFTTFAVLLLVREHSISIQTTALLYLVNSIVNTYSLRAAGQVVGRVGERLVLTFTFASLAFVFLGYAVIDWLPALFALFVLDNVFFGFNIALTTYFQKIAVDREEITSNLATEQAIQHIAAIIIPLIGGTVWVLFGPQAPFLVGIGVVIAGLALTQLIRIEPAPTVAAAN